MNDERILRREVGLVDVTVPGILMRSDIMTNVTAEQWDALVRSMVQNLADSLNDYIMLLHHEDPEYLKRPRRFALEWCVLDEGQL